MRTTFANVTAMSQKVEFWFDSLPPETILKAAAETHLKGSQFDCFLSRAACGGKHNFFVCVSSLGL